MILTLSILLLAITAVPTLAVTGPDDFYGPTDVTFYLYTQYNPGVPEIIKPGVNGTSHFNQTHPTRFILHGGYSNYTMFLTTKNAYIRTGKLYNVVLIDWSGVAALPEMTAMETSWMVGDYIGEVIDELIERRGLNLNKVHIIGHSMGGQLAGIVGNRLGGRVAEIVGLDPASDIYDNNPPENQLDSSDAQFVQIIHTNGPGLGIPDPRGHIDFIVNNGSFQPGCEGWHFNRSSGARSPEGDNICSHGRVVDLFIESISSHQLIGVRCSNYSSFLAGYCNNTRRAVLGEDTPTNVTGVFVLKTNSSSPYGLGDPHNNGTGGGDGGGGNGGGGGGDDGDDDDDNDHDHGDGGGGNDCSGNSTTITTSTSSTTTTTTTTTTTNTTTTTTSTKTTTLRGRRQLSDL